MAASFARKTLQVSSASAKTLFARSSPSSSSSIFASRATKLSGISSASSRRLFFRRPVELAGVQSLMPLHSVTASALFTSLLSLHDVTWGCLSEGFGTTL